MPADFDIGIVGAGFGGALMAMIARRLDKSVVLLEKGAHPRFAIGESSTPLANLILEELSQRWDLPRIRPLAKWGAWQKAYPNIACGLKRGFSFFHHELGQHWKYQSNHQNELLVTASPHDEIADTHWFRADVDQFLVNEAISEGAEYLDHVALHRPEFMGDIVKLSGLRLGKPIRLQVHFLVDASGPRGFLHQTLKLPAAEFATMPATAALYSHFENVARFADSNPHDESPPYPIDDAAVHHVFPGGWIWVLRFNNGITSAGVAASDELAKQLDFGNRAKAWERLLAFIPSVREQFASARPVREFTHAQPLAFRTNRVSAERWTMLPHTAGFVDPLLSTGFPLNLLGIERLAETIGLRNASRFEARMEQYSRQTLAELDFTALLISALYANMSDFELFSALSLLYFAAASFSETQRRLGKTPQGFLLNEHRAFGPAVRNTTHAALTQPLLPHARTSLLKDIRNVIEPFNIAGLNDPARRNWYPALADDLLQNHTKLGASE
ncbi:MAG TPA: tryptophan 7-halogenase, partial [Verrucomicrobiae bacterium]|nr:tryptophan 7-halogenase [Verrucomicrobiae bacterium]